MVAFESFAIPTRRGAQLHVRVRGPRDARGSTLLFCDGLGCSGFVFEKLFPEFPAARLVHFQYTGHGASSSEREHLAQSVTELAEELEDVIAWLESDVVIVGHSLGAQVAMEAALSSSCGGRVSGLVLISGVTGRMTHTFKGSDWLARVVPLLRRLYARAPSLCDFLWRRVPTDAALVCGRFLGDISALVEDREMAPYFEHLRGMSLAHFLALLSDLGEHDLTPRLPQLELPALVIAGEDDTFTPIAENRALAEQIGARLVAIEGGTHVTPLEAPGRIAEEVRRFLEQNARIAL